jgi:very-short-patch-repair endonuclease
LSAEQTGSMGGFDSPFEEAIAERLSDKGWQIVTQIGVSGFRVDLGVVNPDKPGAYLAGIECDGATYHRSATARDRDKIREQILRHLGREIIRIWSPDWWYDCEGATEHVHQLLCDLLEDSRNSEQPCDEESALDECENGDAGDDAYSEELPALGIRYAQVQAVSLEIDAEAFFAVAYTDKLRSVVLSVLQAESPIRDDVLAQRVARLHQFSRTSTKIRDRILTLIEDVQSTQESTGRFLWASIAHYFTAESEAIAAVESELAALEQQLDEVREENSGEEGLLVEVIEGEGDKQKITAKGVKARLRDIGAELPTIGILLCHRKNDALVELTLPKDANIFASKYQLYLPSKEELKTRLEQITHDLERGETP